MSLTEKKSKAEIIQELITAVLQKIPTIQYCPNKKMFYYYNTPKPEEILDKQTMQNKNYYIFDDGHKIKCTVQELIGTNNEIRLCNEICGHIERSNSKSSDTVPITDLKFINLENGVFNTETNQLIPHTDFAYQYNYFFNKIPVKYDKEAKCPKILKFLNDILEPNDVQTIIEFTGYCLYRSYTDQKAIMLTGMGNNGKSRIIELLRTFLGTQNCCSVELKQIINNQFSIAELHNKSMNCFADIGNELLESTGRFKALTGGDLISVERKFQHPFQMINHAKFIFSANQLPETPDDTSAFFKRWIIIFCNKKFNKDNGEDKFIIQKITTDEELSGFLNLAIDGLKKVLKDGFTYAQTEEEVKNIYLHLSDSVRSFFVDCLEVDEESQEDKGLLYQHYFDYCNRFNLSPSGQTKFWRVLKDEFPQSYERRLSDNARTRVQRGIAYKSMSAIPSIFKLLLKGENTLAESDKNDRYDGHSKDSGVLPEFVKLNDYDGNDVALFGVFDEQTINYCMQQGLIFKFKPNWYKRV